jgi:invasion protein IalB
MTRKLWPTAAIGALSLLLISGSSASAQMKIVRPVPLQIASLVDDGQVVDPGDVLRTTRMYPNWNLNCEVLLSQGKHLCAVEMRSVDVKGNQVLSWSIALSKAGDPIMIFRIPGDADRSFGLRISIGAFTTILLPQPGDCSASECRMIAPFETPLRTLMVSQEKVTFGLSRAGQALKIEAPLTGMSEALAAARRDPIGLVATQQAKAEKPSMSALKLRSSQR